MSKAEGLILKEITPKEAYDAVSGGSLLLDVRENEERAIAYIEGSYHTPLSVFPHVKLPDINGKNVVVYCAKGGRSGKACIFLGAAWQETANFLNMKGGIEAWIAEGLPVKSSDSAS